MTEECLEVLKHFFLLLLLCLLSAKDVRANTPSLSDLLALDITDLVQVSVASKKEESVREAPSVIHIVTQNDIKTYGAVNLLDVIYRLPSVHLLGSTLPNNRFSVRGQSTHILYLLNGRPLRHSWDDLIQSAFFLQFPLSAIEKIEIIRGPGSVLYGANAFSSVFNIVTKQPPKELSGELSTAFGSDSLLSQEVSGGLSGENWGVHVSAKNSESNGWDWSFTDRNNVFDEFDTEESGFNHYLNGHYGDFTLQFMRARNEQKQLATLTQAHPAVDFNVDRTFVDLGFSKSVFNGLDLDLNATHNYFSIDRTADSLGIKNYSSDLLLEASVNGQITDSLDFLIGATFENQDGQTIFVNHQQHTSSLYSQLSYWPLEWLKLVGGLQINQAEGVKRDYSPRASAIALLNDEWTFKLMYGEAYRVPTGIEQYFEFGSSVVVSDELSPEHIETYEAQLLYDSPQFNSALTFFRSRHTDLIDTTDPGGLGFQVTDNYGEEVSCGIELEFDWNITEHFKAEGSLTYHHIENSDDIDNPNYVANNTFKMGISYDSLNGWGAGIFNSYFGDPSDITTTDAVVRDRNERPESFHLLSANLNADLNDVLNLPNNWPEMGVSFYLNNALDEDVNYVSVGSDNANEALPILRGREVYGRFTIKF